MSHTTKNKTCPSLTHGFEKIVCGKELKLDSDSMWWRCSSGHCYSEKELYDQRKEKIDFDRESEDFDCDVLGNYGKSYELEKWAKSIAERVEEQTIQRCREYGNYHFDVEKGRIITEYITRIYSEYISQCPKCFCMTKTIGGQCGKCKSSKLNHLEAQRSEPEKKS